MLIYILYTAIYYAFHQELSPIFWGFGPAVIYLIISTTILLVIAWFKPVGGGILILSTSIVVPILGFSTALSGGGGVYFFGWCVVWVIPLILPGLLFLLFGRVEE